MRAGTTDDRLGRLISTHPVATTSRRTNGLLGVLSFVLGAALAAYVIVEPFGTKTDGKLLGVAVLGLGAGVWLVGSHLVRAVRGGWHESFEVHRHGLVHRGWRVRSWTWQQVTRVRVRGDGELLKFRCLIHFDDGARVCVDGLVEGGHRLVNIVAARCPAAVPSPPPRN